MNSSPEKTQDAYGPNVSCETFRSNRQRGQYKGETLGPVTKVRILHEGHSLFLWWIFLTSISPKPPHVGYSKTKKPKGKGTEGLSLS